MEQVNVTSFIERKNGNNDFTPIYLSPEQRFVQSLKNSGVHNLEEQLLIGSNRVITTSIDEHGNTHKIIEYKDPNSNETNYFKIDILSNPNGINAGSQISFEGSAVQFLNKEGESPIAEWGENGNVIISDNLALFSSTGVILASSGIIERDILSFGSTDIATKQIRQQIENDSIITIETIQYI